MDLNNTIQTPELQGVLKYFSIVPKFLTEQITTFLRNYNVQVTERWTSGMILLMSMGLILSAIFLLKKVSPIIKLIFFALAILLILGIFVPFW